MDREIVLVFDIQGDEVHPENIQANLKIKNARVSIKGSRNKDRCLPRSNRWILESTTNSQDLKDHWDEIYSQVSDLTDEIIYNSKDGVCSLTIYIYSSGRIPAMQIPLTMSKFASDVKAIVDIDHIQ